MSAPLTILTFAAALGSCLVAGIFFAFSTFVMAALARLRTAEGIRAMQSINVTVITPSFMVAFGGTAVASAAAAIVATIDWNGASGPYVLAGAALYLVGAIGVTMGANVPRNDALSELDPTGPEAASAWSGYLREWTTWNHVRTVAALLASAFQIGALNVG